MVEISKNSLLNILKSWQETCINGHRFYLSKFLDKKLAMTHSPFDTRCILIIEQEIVNFYNFSARIFNDLQETCSKCFFCSKLILIANKLDKKLF